MADRQTLHRSSIVLLAIIALTTLGFWALAHESSPFMAIWTILLVVSIVKASWGTRTFIDPAGIGGAFRGRRKRTGQSQKGSFPQHEPIVNTDVMKDYLSKQGGPSLFTYLGRIDYQLNDQILDAIEWKRFELLCHLMFQAEGYRSEMTGDGADEGVDIRVYLKSEPSTTLYLVQCKKFAEHQKVSRPTIQQLKGQMAAEGVAKGGFCTTSSFTLPALEFARSNNIEPFDRTHIITAFGKLPAGERPNILAEVLKGDYWTPSCSLCGLKAIKRKSKSGVLFWGCENFPKHGGNGMKYFEARPLDTSGGT